MFDFENICYKYATGAGEFTLENISFRIEKGECVGLTGPSGCGKSTLAQIAAGYLAPSSGRVRVDGQDLTGRPNRSVLLIHQENDLFPWQKVEKQIVFAQKTADRNKVKELISLVKLEGFENHFPSQLSGGMKKRLALARVLAIEPKLIILDEAFSSLDTNLKMDLHRDLRRIWEKTKTTILLITHDSRDLANLAHREVKLSAEKPTRIVDIFNRSPL